MLDIHTHILPCIDDGANTISQAIEMLKAQKAIGVNIAFLTPHSISEDHKWNSKELIISKFNEFKLEVDKLDLGIDIYLGEEVYYGDKTLSHLKEHDVVTMNNSKYLLVEFGFNQPKEYIKEGLYNIKVLGYTPILAHVERFFSLDKNDLIELHNEGVLLQVNANTLYKHKLIDKRYNIIKSLLNKGYISFIASDSHDLDHRMPNLDKVKDILDKHPEVNKFIF